MLKPHRPIVIIESPYAGDIEHNEAYARAAVRDCIRWGEAPYASHLLYAQLDVLNDADPEERKLGMECGHEFLRVADYVIVYYDLGYSNGMRQGIARALAAKKEIKYRSLSGWVART